MPPTILLSAPLRAPSDLASALAPGGLAVVRHALGATPPVDFTPVVAAVVEVADHPAAAAAQTRRWRIELGDTLIPIVWVLPASSDDLAALGLDAGADAVLARPFAPQVLLAQVRAAARLHAAAARAAAKAAEARLLGDQLRKAFAQLDRDHALAERVRRTFRPAAFPEVGSIRFAVCHRSRGRAGTDLHDIRRLDEDHVGFCLGDLSGHAAAAGGLLGVFVLQSVRWKEITGAGYRLVPPEDVLAGVNRELLGLGPDDPPLVALAAGVVNGHTGTISVARAGTPAPVFVPAAGDPEVWAVPGPFLGTAETTYQPVRRTLAPGDKLVFGTDGTRPDGDSGSGADHLAAAALTHRHLTGPAFTDAVARTLLPHVRHPDDFTLLTVERVNG